MWPLKRKKEDKDLRPVLAPEIWEWDSAIGQRLNRFFEENPTVMFEIESSGFSTLSVYFDCIGTATLSVTYLAEGHIQLQPVCWVADDPDRDRRGFGFTGYGPDGSLRLTLPTNIAEQTGKTFTFGHEMDFFGVKPTESPFEVAEWVAKMKQDRR